MTANQHPKNWVKHYRKLKGWSAQKLSDNLDNVISREMIGYIERREKALTLINAKKIARALDVNLLELVEGPLPEPENNNEKKLLETYRGMSEKDQERFIAMGEIYNRPLTKEDK